MSVSRPKAPEAPRRSYDRKRGGAMYGMQQTIATAMITNKQPAFAPAVWNYQPGKTRLVKMLSK